MNVYKCWFCIFIVFLSKSHFTNKYVQILVMNGLKIYSSAQLLKKKKIRIVWCSFAQHMMFTKLLQSESIAFREAWKKLESCVR